MYNITHGNIYDRYSLINLHGGILYFDNSFINLNFRIKK